MNMNLHGDQSQREVVKKSSYASGSSTKREAECSSSKMKKKLKLTLKDQKMHHLVFQEGGLPEGTEVVYKSHGRELLKGYKQGRGILCDCCKKEISASLFEDHAGMASRKKPYNHIFLSDGMSLHDYANTLKMNRENMPKENDALCKVCRESGDLIPCEGCPRSFHKECIDVTVTPLEKWFCPYCQKSMGVESNGNAKRRIRLTNNLHNREIVACVLCRACDFSEDGFNDRTVIVCDQCEKEYHIGCLWEHKKIKLEKLPHGNWFCTLDCVKLHDVLTALGNIEQSVPDSEDGNSVKGVKWVVRRCKNASKENRLLLEQVVEMFHECFNPIIDSVTGKDFISSMAYGLQMGASDFSGVYCGMLTTNSKVITAGMFRVFGYEIAELSLVATDQPYQKKGFFHLFLSCFERMLSYLRVKKVVVPAAEDTKLIWKKKLGFRKVIPKQLSEYTSMVAFDGTSFLEKDIPETEVTFKNDEYFSDESIQSRLELILGKSVASSSDDSHVSDSAVLTDSANESPAQNAPEQSLTELKEENSDLKQRVLELESKLADMKNKLKATKRELKKSKSEKSVLREDILAVVNKST